METKIVSITRQEKLGNIYPSIKSSQYGLSMYIGYQDSCAKEIYNTVKTIVDKLVEDEPEYDVISPLTDNGTGMYLRLTANPFKDWGTQKQLDLRFTTPWKNTEKKEIRFKCVMTETSCEGKL